MTPSLRLCFISKIINYWFLFKLHQSFFYIIIILNSSLNYLGQLLKLDEQPINSVLNPQILSNQSQIWNIFFSLTWSEVRSVPRLIFGVCVGSSLVNIRSSWDEARCSDGNKEEVQIISSRNSIVSFFNLILHSKSCKEKEKISFRLNQYLWVVEI